MALPKDAALGVDLLDRLVSAAKRAGADAADAMLAEASSLSVSVRLGAVEMVERAESVDLGLRVFIGHQQAQVSTSDLRDASLDDLVARAVAMARVVPEDPFGGLADPAELAQDVPDLDLYDPTEPDTQQLTALALRCEDAARAQPGISNSDGGSAGWGRHRVTLVASNGLCRSYPVSSSSLSVAVLASDASGAMERDYDYSSALHFSDLTDPETIGRSAAERTVRRLGARKPASARLPVVFDPRVSRSFLGHLTGAINGAAIARGTSFLKDSLGKQILPPSVSVIDDPHRRRGLGSKPFDAEGLANRKMALVEGGVLQSWIMDLRSARQLGLKSTGHAARSTGGSPSPATTNLCFAPGTISRDQLIGEISDGFYVTELVGMSVNSITGDYSRGAAGFWIRNGELAEPVHEVTIAGNLKTMFLDMTLADDLCFRYASNAPTLRIDGMTLAGGA